MASVMVSKKQYLSALKNNHPVKILYAFNDTNIHRQRANVEVHRDKYQNKWDYLLCDMYGSALSGALVDASRLNYTPYENDL